MASICFSFLKLVLCALYRFLKLLEHPIYEAVLQLVFTVAWHKPRVVAPIIISVQAVLFLFSMENKGVFVINNNSYTKEIHFT